MLLLLNLGAPAATQPAEAQGRATALIGGTVYPGPEAGPVRDGVVLVRDGTIVAVGSRDSVEIPEAAEAIDCSGLTVTAGFWNSHVHFFERKWADAGAIPAEELARQLLDTITRYGFTSVFDTGSSWENTARLRDRVESGEVAGPRIHSTGEALLAPESMPPDRVLRALGFMTLRSPEVADAAQAIEASRALLRQGVDGIKIHLQPPPAPNPPIPQAAIRAIVDEARRHGKTVFAHPSSHDDLLAAVRNGVDVITHTTPHAGPWGRDLLAEMKARRVALTPTLTLWKSVLRHDRISAQERLLGRAVDQLRAWLALGGEVLFGTDLGAVEPDPVEEYALMEGAGMSFRQILASLTSAPAERFKSSDRVGRIAPGLRADLVVLSADPAEDVRAFASVQYTLRDGRLIYRQAD